MVFKIGYSLQGKDKGNIYIIVKEEISNYWLCDGKRFPIEKPKKKNKKHLQLIKKYSIDGQNDISNEKIIELLNIIYKDIQEVK